MAQVKKTRGRQKIEIKKIENEENRLITFSKRKSGIIKKAVELCVMCGAKVAFIIFSPVGKAYSFGHPSIKWVTDKFLNKNLQGQPQQQNDPIENLIEAHRNNKINELSARYNALVEQLDAEKERGKMLKRRERSRIEPGWWEKDANELELDEVMKFNATIVEFQNQLSKQMDRMKRRRGESSSSSSLNINQIMNSPFMAGYLPSNKFNLYHSASLTYPSPGPGGHPPSFHLSNHFGSPSYPPPGPVAQPSFHLFNHSMGAGSSGAGPSAYAGPHGGVPHLGHYPYGGDSAYPYGNVPHLGVATDLGGAFDLTGANHVGIPHPGGASNLGGNYGGNVHGHGFL